MFINNIDPVLFKIGMFEIRYYGLIFVLGFIISYFFLVYFIKKGKLELKVKKLDDLFLYLVLGIVIGARLFYVFFYSPEMLFAPASILRVWEGGLAFHGGLIGAIVAVIFFSRRNKIKVIQVFDALAVPASLSLAFGRIANFTNHELYGYVTNVPWCVVFRTADGCRHPYQLYAFLSHLIMFSIIIYVYNRQRKEGSSFWAFILVYGAFRFLTDFFKIEYKYFGLGIGQIASIIMVGLALYAIIKKKLIVFDTRSKDKA
ncbi:prolipoprotein diacylglyceryl transferase [Candidatus Woesearchaeota archaeon]|nr:prolipoprotein diacylglyceryl transferase [Candidatus Woesearchaeota archaeon]